MWVAIVVHIKKANKSVSRLSKGNYPITLSPDDKLTIKNKELFCVFKGQFIEGNGEILVNDHLSNLIFRGRANFVDWHIILVIKMLSSNNFYRFTIIISTMI